MATYNNSTSGRTITGTNSADTIRNEASRVTINALGGNDLIHNISYASNISIKGGDGNDTVDYYYGTLSGGNWGSNWYVDLGAGDDYSNIRNISKVTINGGDGNDYIRNDSGDNVKINAGTGNDEIYNRGEDVIIDLGWGNSTISNWNNNVTINGGADNDIISNSYANDVTINGSAGHDYISNEAGDDITINGGDGNDTITSRTYSRYISSSGWDVTINGGAGDDYISLGGGNNKIFYNAGDGNDTISGATENDTINIFGSTYTRSTIKNDVILTVGNGSIRLKDASNTNFKVTTNASDNPGTVETALNVTNNISNKLITGTALNDTIYNSGDNVTINALAGDDSIRNYDSEDVTITAGEGNDTISNSSGEDIIINGNDGDDSIHSSYSEDITINGGAGADSIHSSYGKNITLNGGTGADSIYSSYGKNIMINGGTGNDSIDNDGGSNITIDGGSGNDIIASKGYNSGSFSYNSCDVTINGGTGDDYIALNGGNNKVFYNSGDGNDTIEGYISDLTLSISGDTYSSTGSGNDVIITVDDGSILLKNATNLSSIDITSNATFIDPTILNITNSTKSPVTVDSVVKTIDASTRKRPIRITGNALDNSITGGKGKDTIYGGAGNDTLTDTNGKNIFIYDSGNDIITDFNEKKDKINLSADYQSYALNGEDLILNFGNNNSLTIKDGAGKKISSVKDRKKADNIYTSSGILGDKKKSMTLLPTVTNFDATSAKDYSKVVTIDGSAAESEIAITGNSKKNYITAGAGDSTLSGGKGNDTLIGGDGQDVFIYSNGDGKDIVENYDAGDRINLNGATIKDAMIKNNSGVIKIGSGSLTVKDTSEFILADGNSETIVSDGVFIAEGVAKVYSSFKGTIDLDEHDLTTADASLAKKATTINGGTLADSIVGGKGSDKLYGNEGADILIGGKGNDSLWGDDDNDTFIYNAGTGNDFIMDYAEGDMLRILDKQGNEGSFSKATFGNETLTLNITSGGKVTFKNVSETTAFNINGESYHVEGKTLAQ